MKRLLALVAAAGMVVGAVVLRNHLDSGGGAASSSNRLSLVCVSELASVCEGVQAAHPTVSVQVEEAAVTEARLSQADFDPAAAGIDGWLTIDPFPTIVDDTRTRAGLGAISTDDPLVLAWSPLVEVIWNDRRDVLAGACGTDDISWRCIGDHAGQPWTELGGSDLWGALKPGQPSPDQTAVGLLALGQAASSWFGGTDYASNDFAQPGFRRWFDQLEEAPPYYPTPPTTPLDEMLGKGPATFDVAASTEAAASAVAASRDNSRLSVIYPSPSASATVVLASLDGAPGKARLRAVLTSDDTTELLTAAGWRVDSPADSAMPRPGVLVALRDLWVEAVR